MNNRFYFQLLFYILIFLGVAQLFRAVFLETSTTYNYDLGRFVGLIILSIVLFLAAFIIKKKWLK